MEGVLVRIYRKALANHLVIAVGAGCGDASYSIPTLGDILTKQYGLPLLVHDPLEYFPRWNQLVSMAETRVSRSELMGLVGERVRDARPTPNHQSIASIPISNFIDTTFDRSLFKAIVESGKTPILHDWRNQMIGIWRQSNPEHPNIFFSLPPTDGGMTLYGISEPTAASPQNRIQIENMREMLSGKDLLLVGISTNEAEYVLHLGELCLAYEKCYVVPTDPRDAGYWAARGVLLADVPMAAILDQLVPAGGQTYSALNGLVPRTKLIDIVRDRQYDAFVSYFSGDRDFVSKLVGDLMLRGLHIWRDEREIDIGDSMSDKIQQGLAESYTFIVVLSPEALLRPWVKEELRAAYSRRLAGDLKILPVVHRECEIPPFLGDYKYADFRDPRRYEEQLSLLERGIQNAVSAARGKK